MCSSTISQNYTASSFRTHHRCQVSLPRLWSPFEQACEIRLRSGGHLVGCFGFRVRSNMLLGIVNFKTKNNDKIMKWMQPLMILHDLSGSS